MLVYAVQLGARRWALPIAGLWGAMLAVSALCGCAGHEARTLRMRTALDAWQPREAITALDKELDVVSPNELPHDLQGDNALLVLDRAAIEQAIAKYPLSEHDFQAADKAIDMLDLAHNASDTIGTYIFSGSAGRYVAPPYEKLLINTLNMLNYLLSHDLNGARIEARRMSVLENYFVNELREDKNPVLGLGGFLAGFTWEKSNSPDEALRYYEEAISLAGFKWLRDPIRTLLPVSSYRSPRLQALVGQAPPLDPMEQTGESEIVIVMGYGRVPHKIPQRIPIGLALTYFADAIEPTNAAAANRLAAQGLVTWINYPTLAPERGSYETPTCLIDGRPVLLEQSINVTEQVRAEWKKVEGKIVASALTRLISRYAVGEGARAALGKDSMLGLLASLGTQATLTVLDKPDTRSWESLPARIVVARVRAPAGKHTLQMQARGVIRNVELDIAKGDWAVASLMAIR